MRAIAIAVAAAFVVSCSGRDVTYRTQKVEGEECAVSTECAPGLSCIDGACEADTCREASECTGEPAGGCGTWACVAGRCVSGCGFGDGGVFDGGVPRPDVGFADAVVTPPDSGVPPADTGVAPADTGVAPDDTGVAPDDTGVAPADTGVGPADTGVGPADTGVVPSCDPTPRAPRAGNLIVNEVLADPAAGNDGDANRDGTRDATGDEFIEIANTSSATIDLNGVAVFDSTAVRHVFAAGTLGCGKVIVIFGGGNPSHANWRANWVLASTRDLSLANTGDEVHVRASGGAASDVSSITYGTEANSDQSLVRRTELDGAAALIQHTTHPSAGGRRFSPGVRADGAEF